MTPPASTPDPRSGSVSAPPQGKRRRTAQEDLPPGAEREPHHSPDRVHPRLAILATAIDSFEKAAEALATEARGMLIELGLPTPNFGGNPDSVMAAALILRAQSDLMEMRPLS
eukprot:12136600-Prorocentrum_lima.AAC.1